MTTNSEIDHAPIRWLSSGFYAASIVFNVCLIAQLLTVGFAYFNNPAWWGIHVISSSLVHRVWQMISPTNLHNEQV